MASAKVCGCGHDEAFHLVNKRTGKRGPCEYGRQGSMRGCTCNGYHGRRGAKRKTVVDVGLAGTRDDKIRQLALTIRGAADELLRLVPRTHHKQATNGAHKSDLRDVVAGFQAIASLGVTETPKSRPRNPPSSVEIGKGPRKILTAIAQHPKGVTRKQLTVLTGYKRSTRDAYLNRLGVAIEESAGVITITNTGRSLLGDAFERLPTGKALLEHHLANLPLGESEILRLVACVYPNVMDREELSRQTGYARSSRDAYLNRLGARQLVRPSGRGAVRASDHLFDTPIGNL